MAQCGYDPSEMLKVMEILKAASKGGGRANIFATHPDPYPYYARLVAERPFHYDARLKLWVAASAAAVSAVLQSPLCRVRPPAEPVPQHLGDGAAAQVFTRLVRMRDDPAREATKQALLAALSALPPAKIAAADFPGDAIAAVTGQPIGVSPFAAINDLVRRLLPS